MTYIVVIGDPASGKTHLVQQLMSQSDKLYEDIQSAQDIQKIIRYHEGNNELIRWLIIDTTKPDYKNGLIDIEIGNLPGKVAILNIIKPCMRNQCYQRTY